MLFERITEKEVSVCDLEAEGRQPCPKCGVNPAEDCGFGSWTTGSPLGPPEYECEAPDAEELECDGCHHLMCKECKNAERLQSKSGNS